MENFLYENERLDDLHASGYMLIQDPKRFCFGMDAVLLTFFAKSKVLAGYRVLDLGTGNGVIPILLSAKTKPSYVAGLEIQKDSADMAKRSVKLNGLSEKIEIIQGDIKAIDNIFTAETFHVITANPPYIINGGGILNTTSPKAIARHEILLTLEDVVKAASYALKFKGHFFMIHRPNRLTDIIYLMRKYRLEPKTLRFVQPHEGEEPNMVLVEGLKGGGPMIKIEPSLIVYNEDGSYTEELIKIYYGGPN